MTVKRFVWSAFWLFVLFFIVQSPVSASQTARGLLDQLQYAASQVATFATHLFS